MAKHDQRIQKFLNQNADRAPTITEMMTRLNISISDISDSLNSLLAQGLIAKRTNNQGIECWFPAGGQQSAPPQAQPTQQFAIPSHIQAPQLSASQFVGENRSTESRYGSGIPERPMPLPEAQPPMAKPAPVHVQHVSVSERSPTQTHSFSAAATANQPEPYASPAAAPAPMYGFQQPATKGVGFLTFAVGLIAAVGFSTWLAGRLASNEIHKAEKNFVAQKALTDANTAFTDFQGKTKTHIATLEDQVKKLTDQLATSQAATDSLKVATATPAGKAGAVAKTGAAAKAVPPVAPKAEDATAKTKGGKKAPLAKAPKPTSAMAKAAAHALKKKKAMSGRNSSKEGSDASSDEGGATAASYSDPAPSVPQPPGLDNQDLPPPPSE
jgi:hypothetical protein